tara:strand:- start:543 stop:770 length:228 start_codon:yes stop_codon:yes gene_type:complete
MSLLNDRVTEEIQEKIYFITAKLGVVPTRVSEHVNDIVQVNWVNKDGRSFMWRSNLDIVELYDGVNVDCVYLDEL